MKKVFKLEDGKIVDSISYSRKLLLKQPDAKIYISTDSQNKKYKTVFATVIVYRYGHRGAHYIYTITTEKRMRDRYRRLWNETELSLNIANSLTENNIPVYAIELDFNKNETYIDSKGKQKTAGSNFIVDVAKGYCVSMGYKTIVKPEEQIAAKAADHLCRH